MFLTRIFGTSVLLALSAIGLTACLRMADTPDPWPCASDADCSGTTACIANACVPVECTHDDQASCAPYVCNGRECQTSCSSSSGCDSQHACQAGACVPM